MATPKTKSWLPLEANPEVIQKYVQEIGGPDDLHFLDVFSLEQWAMDMLPSDVTGFLFLYPITKEEDKRSKAEFAAQSDSGVKIPENIWYTCQTVGNACGTIAILHLLANLPEREGYSKFKPGSWIEKFMTKTAAADKDARAEALEDDNEIEAAHSAAERQSAAHFDSANGEEVDTHFIALVGVNGRLYEFDGRKGGVIDHGVINEEEGIKGAAGKVMMGFMERLEGENRFNIIAVANSPAADFN